MIRFFIEYLKALMAATGFVALPAGLALAAPAGGSQGSSRLAAVLGVSESTAAWILGLIIAGAWIVAFIVAAWVVAEVLAMLAEGVNFATIVAW